MIFEHLDQQLEYLRGLLLLMNDEQYTRKIEHLDNATIGGHSRHIIELLLIIMNGYENGFVDYLNRKRDLRLENERVLAVEVLNELISGIRREDKTLSISSDSANGGTDGCASTSYFREIIYGTEHAIHHFALIKVALIEMKLHLTEPDFGMAYATIKYRAERETMNA
jgi:hypothetical protein